MSTAKKVANDEKFSRKKDGISFEKLDEMMLSWERTNLETSTLIYFGKMSYMT